MDILSVNQIVNQADNILGHYPTFKVQDVDDQDIKQKRLSAAEKMKPTKLQRSVSRSSARVSSRGSTIEDKVVQATDLIHLHDSATGLPAVLSERPSQDLLNLFVPNRNAGPR